MVFIIAILEYSAYCLGIFTFAPVSHQLDAFKLTTPVWRTTVYHHRYSPSLCELVKPSEF